MRCIEGSGWRRIIHSHPVKGRDHDGLKDPRVWFTEQIDRNVNHDFTDCDGVRQTGRTTLMILKAMRAIKVDRKVPVIICHNSASARHIATDMTDYLNQVSDTLMFMYARYVIMIRDLETGFTRDACYFVTDMRAMRGREYDVIFIDNAIFDEGSHIDDVLQGAQVTKEKIDMPEITGDRSVLASDGEIFHVGDLIQWGSGTAVILDIVSEGDPSPTPWADYIVVLFQGKIQQVVANQVELFTKVSS
ncbi:hypothetical protein CMI47_19340 [Candidatus Pacearchaeota archaeon]|nr:hypothetical protein [Candidatus Pacearchaeota archaeon]|tara:strand:- start:932 stop:1672 length:741 start_codon:yes stop_codon:yes gene_type:complete